MSTIDLSNYIGLVATVAMAALLACVIILVYRQLVYVRRRAAPLGSWVLERRIR